MEHSNKSISDSISSGDDLVKVFDSLSHPMRIQIMGVLAQGRQYVSELARTVNISRPLLYMHLQKLEAAKLIKGNLEISEDGKAMKYYEIQQFDFHVTPDTLFELSKSVTVKKET